MAVAAVDVFLDISAPGPFAIGTCVLAGAALLIRRPWPLLAFALTLPAALVANILAAPIIALFALSARSRRRWLLVVCGALFAAAEAIGWPITEQFTRDQNWTAVTFVYQLATPAAPILLRQLVQTAADMRARID
ncbi:MAG: two-component sensor histidine kinase, partial [Cellulomonas sp.]|nr:two-component sensor histidine kinase [Cellulomonas sp.]